jgi:spore coat polysaccharide biosynthesis predicted glycosyltransferase SpsG
MGRVLFRSDASHEGGMGHVERAARLAEALAAKGHDVTHVVRADGLAEKRLRAKGIVPLTYERDEEEISTVLDARPNLVVLDLGNNPHERVAALKKAGLGVATFDDLGDGRYVADLVVDANLTEAKNPRKMETTTRFLVGPDHAVVDPRLAAGRKRRKYGRWRGLVVALGGTDPENITVKVVRALGRLDPNVEATVILGPGFRGGKTLDAALLQAPRDFDVRIAPDDFAEILVASDIGIVGGGLTLAEAAAAGLPAIVLAQNKAQLANAQNLAESGGCVHLGLGKNVPEGEILAAVRALEDPERRRTLGEAAARVVDGKGLDRVVAALEGVAA